MQQRAVQRDYDSQYEQLPILDEALVRADGAAFGQRWGQRALLDRSADFYSKLCAKYGWRRDVTEFKTFLVLETMAIAVDASRLESLTNKYVQEISSTRRVG